MKKSLKWIVAGTVFMIVIGCSGQNGGEPGRSVSDTGKKVEKVSVKNEDTMDEAKRQAGEALQRAKEQARALERRAETGVKGSVEEIVQMKEEGRRGEPAARTVKPLKGGEALYTKCAGCHGTNGKTKALGKSALIAGQSEEELKKKLMEYRDGSRNINGMGALMKGQVSGLNDSEIAALAGYISRMK